MIVWFTARSARSLRGVTLSPYPLGDTHLESGEYRVRVLGINCTSRQALLAVVEGGTVLPDLPEIVEIPNAMTLNSDLTRFRDEVRRRLTQIGPDRVAVLFAETMSKGAHTSWTPLAFMRYYISDHRPLWAQFRVT